MSRRDEFVASLEPIRPLTEDDLARAVAALPLAIRHRLAEGPIARRWSCGVCEAFGAEWYKTAADDPTDPMWIVFAYHEVPKLDMTRNDQLFDGPLANAIYDRCIATYRAAGWTGEAEPANA